MSDLNIPHAQLRSWDEWLSRWEIAATQEEAVGLLQAGPGAFVADRARAEDHAAAGSRLLHEVVPFYIRVARAGSNRVHSTAAQVIVKSWLRHASDEAHEITNLDLLGFLSESPRSSLREPPYPRFVAQYLERLHSAWRSDLHHKAEEERLHVTLRKNEHDFVFALCQWGLGHLLSRSGTMETVSIIEEFVRTIRPSTGRYEPIEAISQFVQEAKSLEKLSFTSSSGRDPRAGRAIAAALYIRYWEGSGTWLINPMRMFHEPEGMRDAVFAVLCDHVIVDQPSDLPNGSLLFSGGPNSLTDDLLQALEAKFHLVPKH